MSSVTDLHKNVLSIFSKIRAKLSLLSWMCKFYSYQFEKVSFFDNCSFDK